MTGAADRAPAIGEPAVELVGVVAVVAVLGVVLVIALVGRRWVLAAPQSAFECRVRSGDSGPWRAGVARYEAARLSFFPALALSWWPAFVLYRDRLSVTDRRAAAEAGDPAWATGTTIILRCHYDDRIVELAMDQRVAGGFAVWVESGPPGRGVNVA